MFVKIERIQQRGEPCWRLYLNEFFIPCSSYDEACRLRCEALESDAHRPPEPAHPVVITDLPVPQGG